MNSPVAIPPAVPTRRRSTSFFTACNVTALRKSGRFQLQLPVSSRTNRKSHASPTSNSPTLLRDGPLAGIHVIATCGTQPPLWSERSIALSMREVHDNRIPLPDERPTIRATLIDSPAGNKLGYRSVPCSTAREQGIMERFRPYALPGPKWLEYVKQSLNK